MRGSFLINRIRAPRENDSFRSEIKLRDLLGTWQHLAEDIELSETASYTWNSMSACHYSKPPCIRIQRLTYRCVYCDLHQKHVY